MWKGILYVVDIFVKVENKRLTAVTNSCGKPKKKIKRKFYNYK